MRGRIIFGVGGYRGRTLYGLRGAGDFGFLRTGPIVPERELSFLGRKVMAQGADLPASDVIGAWSEGE